MIDIYGTLGPKCEKQEVLEEMFRQGMTGIRLNLSHTTILEAKEQIDTYHNAAKACGVSGKLLIDMQGPELRIGKLERPMTLMDGQVYENIPFPSSVNEQIDVDKKLLVDDGKLELKVVEVSRDKERVSAKVLRGGTLYSGKSIAVEGDTVHGPALTEQDLENLKHAKELGVTGVMQPFVRSAEDLKEVREAMNAAGCEDVKLFAKIENMEGVNALETFFEYADEIVIARGDLGNAMPLWRLPRIQKKIAKECKKAKKPFMIVTQMLTSMEHCAVPTRAEVCDIYNAILDGASSVMVTGETAVGEYPAEVMKYLANTVKEALGPNTI